MSDAEHTTIALTDIEAFKVMLENAEISYEQFSDDGVTPSIEIENGLIFHFDNQGKLERME